MSQLGGTTMYSQELNGEDILDNEVLLFPQGKREPEARTLEAFDRWLD